MFFFNDECMTGSRVSCCAVWEIVAVVDFEARSSGHLFDGAAVHFLA